MGVYSFKQNISISKDKKSSPNQSKPLSAEKKVQDKKLLIVEVIDPVDQTIGTTAGKHSVTVNGVTDMVSKVIAKAKKEKGIIIKLVIKGHGNVGLQSIGGGKKPKSKTGLANANLTKHKMTLRKLRPYLHKKAIVVLMGCNTGKGKQGSKFLKNLSTILGVPVRAGISLQVGLMDGLEGSVKKCTKVKCRLKSSFTKQLWDSIFGG